MPLPWAARGLRNGIVTSPWPRRDDAYFDSFRAAVEIREHAATPARLHEVGQDVVLDAICPTGALGIRGDRIRLDRGRCILCGRCVETMPDVFTWADGSDVAAMSRQSLVHPLPEETDAALLEVRQRLDDRIRRLRRSVHIRHVDTGSDGSDEWEVQALLNPVYDVHRLGIFFTASPRHADILLVTGVGAPFMRAPLRRTRTAMPDPVVVIAVGADAVSGGLLSGGYAGSSGVGELIDVDVWVPGSPASPFTLLHAILLALGRVPESSMSAKGES